MANEIIKTQLHPQRPADETNIIYPETSVDQVKGLPVISGSEKQAVVVNGDGYSTAPYNAPTQIRVGETQTLPEGYPASVQNVGTPTAPILNFQIPQGKTGMQGPKGKDGLIPTIDSELSDSSENPVQNKVIKSALDKKSDKTDVDKIRGSFFVQNVGGYSFAKIMSPNTVCVIELGDAIKIYNRNVFDNSSFYLEALPRNLIHITSLNLYNSNDGAIVNNSFDFVFLGGQNNTWVNNKTTTIINLSRDTFFACPSGWAPCVGKVTNVNGEISNVNAFRITDTGGIEFIIQSNVSKLYDPTYKITFGANTNIHIDLKGATAN